MAKNQLKKCLWILDTIYRTGGISYKDISARWELEHGRDSLGKLSNSSFREYIRMIEDMFDINIECIYSDDYKYHITSEHDLEGRNARSRLLKAFAMNNILSGHRALEGRVIYEDIPSGEKHLLPILDAMLMNREIEVVYASFRRNEPMSYHIEPYAVKVHGRRWYLLARYLESGRFLHLALDRMKEVQTLDATFSIDPEFDVEAYYDGAYGVMTDMEDEYDVEDVRIKVYNDFHRVEYLRTLPLHRSQKEVETSDENAVFSYRLRPTDDFLYAVLALGGDAEVLEPAWFRKYVSEELKRMLGRYGRTSGMAMD
ncbi:MAG: WYL domain-containing protein [Muribaculaceae bacterium]|nr:WYL domain-containing protein [Muribaculaceae bacterium]